MSLIKHKQDWEELGNTDPFWAILTDKRRQFGKWDIDEFFLTGDQEIGKVMQSALRLGYPPRRELALDFGCGLGRLTRALANYFQQCYGVDISESMIVQAKELNRHIQNCKFILNTAGHLQIFPDNYFDMIYTNIVLQHLPNQSIIKSYIFEFIRTLKKDGVFVFQLPSYIPIKNRLQPRRRLYALLKILGFNTKFLYEKLGLNPIRMNFIPEDKVVIFLKANGAKILEIQEDLHKTRSIQSRIYYVTK